MEPVSIAEGAEERQTTNRAVSETCPNCGAEVLGSYCHQCGQEHTVRVRPLRGLLTDALGDLFSFDNRLFRTLKLLLFRPGFLTIEYLKGRRAPYVPPFRLYLIVSIVYFSIASLLGTESFFFLNVEDSNEQAFRYIELLPKLMFLILPGFALLLKGSRQLKTLLPVAGIHESPPAPRPTHPCPRSNARRPRPEKHERRAQRSYSTLPHRWI